MTAHQNELAYFSSVGPAIDGSLKPDLVAAGSSSSAYNGLLMATQSYDPNSFLFSTTRYIGAAGTSFASPLVAGAAALVKQKHPTLDSGADQSGPGQYGESVGDHR